MYPGAMPANLERGSPQNSIGLHPNLLPGRFAASGPDLLRDQKLLDVSGSEGRTCLQAGRVSMPWGMSAPQRDGSLPHFAPLDCHLIP